jgi:hypothetical protein
MATDEFERQILTIEEQEARDRRQLTLAILVCIAVASIAIRILIRYDFNNSALLYIAIPFLISLAIATFRPPRSNRKWWYAYRDHTYIALIIFLGSSIVLFEGFVCVLFFMPIYFLVVSIGFLLAWYRNSGNRRNSTTFVTALPLLILATAFEGTSEDLSFSRVSEVSASRSASLPPAEIIKNLSEPINLQKNRNWLLSIFPMPYRIDAGSLNPGDVHRVYPRYHRWLATKAHEGELHLQIVDVEPNRVTTRFIHDSSYFASYLTVNGTEITLDEIAPGQTQITLRIEYERKLDPAWYFHPLQQYGVGKMAEFLIDEVMIRE